MEREQAKELLPIIQAFAEGKEIQCISEGEEDWCTIKHPTWNKSIKYRVKPEPKYRPFNNAKEFIEALNEHGGWMRAKHSSVYFIPLRVKFDSIASTTSTVYLYSDVLACFVFYDDTPCGIKE